MTEDTGSTVPRRQVGRLMRRPCEQAGISLMAAATELEFSRARMCRIEGGESPLRKIDVEAMCRMYHALPALTSRLSRRGVISPSPGGSAVAARPIVVTVGGVPG